MVRVKKGTNAIKNRRNTLKRVKGYRFGRSTKERQANEAIVHADSYRFAHRRTKKRDMRRLWNTKISAALMPTSFSYSKFIGALKKANIAIDRKTLAILAENKPKAFEKVVEKVS
jgi:large subunit ribosomal protein L20